MSDLSFKIISEPGEVRRYWELFSPHQTIDDEWDFRTIWRSPYDFPFHFIVGFDGQNPVGLLPLQLNTVKGLGPKLLEMSEPFLEFFGGIDTDDNRIFLKKGFESSEKEFLKQITYPTVLTSLVNPYAFGESQGTKYLDRYELDLVPVVSFENYLQTQFDGVSRQRLINRINHLEKRYTVEIKEGTAQDLNLLFDFSITRFGEKSSFHRSDRRELYQTLLKTFDVDLFIINLNHEPKAISFGIMFKKNYITVNIGYDYAIRDMSKYLVVTQLKRAFEKDCTRFDAGQGDNGWKEHFHLTKIPQYKLLLNVKKNT